MKHCRHPHRPAPPSDDDDDEDERQLESGDTGKKKQPRGLDISIRFFDNYNRTVDALKKSLDVIKEKQREQDEAVNFGVGYVEDKKLTHGISLGGVTAGVYGGTYLVFNSNIQACQANSTMHF
jgi:hypothetical protein